MKRDVLSFEKVGAAAEALVGEGRQPTIRALREHLGGGSPNTIHRHLSAWREGRPSASVHADLSPALSAAFAAEVERVSAQARAVLEASLAQARDEAAELAAAGIALEAERDAQAERAEALTRERDTLAGKLDQLAASASDQALRFGRVQDAADSARVELGMARLSIEAQAQRYAEQGAEIERLRAALGACRDALRVSERRADALDVRLEGMAAEAERMLRVEAEREGARRDAAVAREQASRLAGQLEALTTRQGRPEGEAVVVVAREVSKPVTSRETRVVRKPGSRVAGRA